MVDTYNLPIDKLTSSLNISERLGIFQGQLWRNGWRLKETFIISSLFPEFILWIIRVYVGSTHITCQLINLHPV
jgi:hypothetical protein